MLTEAFVFYPVEKYNIQGKELLKTNKKYYIVDNGLRNYLLAKNAFDLDFVLENIIKWKGYKINIGKLWTKKLIL